MKRRELVALLDEAGFADDDDVRFYVELDTDEFTVRDDPQLCHPLVAHPGRVVRGGRALVLDEPRETSGPALLLKAKQRELKEWVDDEVERVVEDEGLDEDGRDARELLVAALGVLWDDARVGDRDLELAAGHFDPVAVLARQRGVGP